MIERPFQNRIDIARTVDGTEETHYKNGVKMGFYKINERMIEEHFDILFKRAMGASFSMTIDFALKTWGKRYPMEIFRLANEYNCILEFEPNKNIVNFKKIKE